MTLPLPSSSEAHRQFETLSSEYQLFAKNLAQQNQAAVFRSDERRKAITHIYEDLVGKELKSRSERQFKQLKLGDKISKRDVRKLNKSLKAYEKFAADLIRQANLMTAEEIARDLLENKGTDTKKIKNGAVQVRKILDRTTSSGLKGFFFRIWYTYIWKPDPQTQKLLQTVSSRMQRASLMQIPAIPNSDMLKIKKEEFEGDPAAYLAMRSGVVGIRGVYRIANEFNQQKIQKQLRSFYGQQLTSQERKPLEMQGEFRGVKVHSRLTPLNSYFDQEMLGEEGLFSSFYGKEGIATSDRLTKGLVNPWQSALSIESSKHSAHLKENRPAFRSLRHGILSLLHEKNETKRHEHAVTMAEHLLKAAVIQEIGERNVTFFDKPLEIDFASVSLVTPDITANLRSSKEKQLLEDQISALKSFEGTYMMKIGEFEVPVKFHIHPFNFGVNKGAMGILKKHGPKLGTAYQYRLNRDIWQTLRPRILETQKEIEKLSDDDTKHQIMKTVDQLTHDVDELLSSEKTYQQIGNQYIVGAKIILLMNQIDRLKGKSCKTAFNCFSGKDRTGVMDAMLKALEIYFQVHGNYPTNLELRNNVNIQKELLGYMVRFLKESGGLEITTLNTGKSGYKIGFEADLWGMLKKEIFESQ